MALSAIAAPALAVTECVDPTCTAGYEEGAYTEISTTAARFTASATEDLEAPELTVSLTSVVDGPLTTLTLRYQNAGSGTDGQQQGIGISPMTFTAEDCPA